MVKFLDQVQTWSKLQLVNNIQRSAFFKDLHRALKVKGKLFNNQNYSESVLCGTVLSFKNSAVPDSTHAIISHFYYTNIVQLS